MTHIVVPGRGAHPVGLSAAAQAVKDYDDTLLLGWNETTNEYVISKDRGVVQEPFPVYSLGHFSEPPSRELIFAKLSRADVKRRGAKIVDDIERANARKRAEAAWAASDASGETAEVYAAAFKEQGFDPFPAVYMPRGVNRE